MNKTRHLQHVIFLLCFMPSLFSHAEDSRITPMIDPPGNLGDDWHSWPKKKMGKFPPVFPEYFPGEPPKLVIMGPDGVPNHIGLYSIDPKFPNELPTRVLRIDNTGSHIPKVGEPIIDTPHIHFEGYHYEETPKGIKLIHGDDIINPVELNGKARIIGDRVYAPLRPNKNCTIEKCGQAGGFGPKNRNGGGIAFMIITTAGSFELERYKWWQRFWCDIDNMGKFCDKLFFDTIPEDELPWHIRQTGKLLKLEAQCENGVCNFIDTIFIDPFRRAYNDVRDGNPGKVFGPGSMESPMCAPEDPS